MRDPLLFARIRQSKPGGPESAVQSGGEPTAKPTAGDDLAAQSLVVLSPEIGRTLASRGRIRFRALGTCMYPAVRPGDLLCVQPRSVAEILPGQIVVCRRGSQLVGHRAMAKGIADGRPYVVTQPDRAASIAQDDGPAFDEDVLGIVWGIERNGKRLRPAPSSRSASGRWWLALRLGLRQLGLWGQRWAISGLARVQSLRIYGGLARRWLASRKSGLRYLVHAPLRAASKTDLCRRLAPDEFAAIGLAPEAGGIDRFTLGLFLGNASRPAASATLVARQTPMAGLRWEAASVEVRIRYRGMGLEELLLAEAERLLAWRARWSS